MRSEFKALQRELKMRVLGREDEVEGLLVAALAGQHLLLLGPPGTGKSMLANLFAQAANTKHFGLLLTQFTTPEEVFGPVKLSALKQDRYERVLDNHLANAESAFLDECYKANSAILNALLTILNERIFDNGGTRVKCPLKFVVGASNELPEDKSLGALDDRFAVRMWIEPLQSDDDRACILGGQLNHDPMPTLTNGALDAARAEVQRVDIAPILPEALALIREIQTDLSVYVSDRKLALLGRLLQAAAWLDGRTTVGKQHLAIFRHALWSHPDQRAAVANKVLAVADPEAAEAEKMLRTIVGAAQAADATLGRAGANPASAVNELAGLNRQTQEELRKLRDLAQRSPSAARTLTRAEDAAKRVHAAISRAAGI